MFLTIEENHTGELLCNRRLGPNEKLDIEALVSKEIYKLYDGDLDLEMEALPDLKLAISHADSIKDYVSRDLFDEILKSEEEHVDWLESQLGLISRMNIENYIQLQT